MINNIENLKDLLEFGEDTLYLVNVIKRKKDQDVKIRENERDRIIRSYYIQSLEYLLEKQDEMSKLCELLNARALLYVNPRCIKKAAFQTLTRLAEKLAMGDYKNLEHLYTSVCSSRENRKGKTWIIDIDNLDKKEDVIKYIGDLYIKEVPSKTGTHLLSRPFNLSKFSKEFEEINVLKDGMINLIIP